MARFADTNVLLYSISREPAEARKRDAAIAILDQDDLVMSVQVLSEFYVRATRPKRDDAIPHVTAVGLIDTWRRFRIVDNTMAVMEAALGIRMATGFSYWDSAVIAAARLAGCAELLTEDLSHGQTIGGVMIVNPFLAPQGQ